MKLFPDFETFIKIGSLEIKWYAVVILIGAVLAYLWCKKTLKKEGKDENLYDNFFLLVLPVSILGARLWYVISEWDSFNTFLEIIDIRKGGLAIQGGVIAGVITGVLYFMKNDKKNHVSYHTDLILPAVLIGQALGRWGNFFNQEVYGSCVDRDSLWMFPDFVLDNMIPNGISNMTSCPTGNVHVPLFLIESILNIIGFVIIGYTLRKFWKKGRKPFDLTFIYVLYYGIVRIILEPLRDKEFQMPTTMYMCAAFIILGIGGLIATRYIFKGKTYAEVYVKSECVEEVKEEKVLTREEMIEAKKEEIRKQRELEKNNHQEDN